MQISERAMLVNLSISLWNAEREDTARAAEIARKYGADKRMVKASRYLVNPEALEPLRKKRGQARNRHYELTLPWGDNADRIITTAGFMRYREEMRAYQTELETMVADFVECYPALVVESMKLLNGLADSTEYPSADRIADRFGMRVTFRPVPEAGDFRCKLSDDDTAAIRQQITAECNQVIADGMRTLADRVKDIVGTLSARMKDDKPGKDGNPVNAFRSAVVENVRDLVDILPGLNVSGSKSVDRLIEDMRAELTGYSVERLKDDAAARKELADKADAILARMEAYGL